MFKILHLDLAKLAGTLLLGTVRSSLISRLDDLNIIIFSVSLARLVNESFLEAAENASTSYHYGD